MARRPLALLSTLGALLAALLMGRVSAQDFYAEQRYPASDMPRSTVTGDLDGDGFPDAVVVCGPFIGSGFVSVLRNDGTGLFLPQSIVPAGGTCLDGALGDVTGDGQLDLVLTIYSPPKITLLPGDGAGGFGAPIPYSIPVTIPALSPRCVALGDVNGDGWLDALTANAANGSDQHNSLFLGDGAGGFLPPVESTPGFVGGDGGMVLRDFNGDDELDLVTYGGLLLGDGAGSFGPYVSLGFPTNGSGYAAGDLNGDGDLDVAQVDSISLRVALSNGLGGFGAPVVYSTGQDHPMQVAIADIDGDGRLDVATANQASGTNEGRIAVLFGNGLGGLGAPLTLPTGGSGSKTSDVAVADFDLDGRADFVACNFAVDTASLYRQTDGTFKLAAAVSYPSLSNSSSVAVADLDGDGDLDAVVSRASTGATETSLVRWLGDGAGGLADPVPYTVGGAQQDVALGDLNGDGRPDVVAVVALLDRAAVLLNDGAGGLLPVTLHPTGDRPVSVALGDVNGDGRLDVITANEQSHDVSVLLGDGAGALAAPASHFVGGLQPNSVAVDDLDDDGALDLVTTNASTQDVSVLLGDGAGGFTVLPALPAGDLPNAAAIGDLDGDGNADLVVAGRLGTSGPLHGELSIFLGQGGGAFAAPLLVPGDGDYSRLALADLNGDGRPDVTVVHAGLSRVSVLLGTGDGGLTPQINHAISSASDVALGDANADQLLDLFVSRRGSALQGYLALALNLSTPHVWHDLGHALPGTFGLPTLVGIGTLLAGSTGTLTLDDAYPSHVGMLFVSPTSAPAAFKGGVLVPVPPLLSQLVLTGPDGRLQLHWTSWSPGAPGSSWYFQYAIVDPAGPANVALSNALRAVQP